MLIIIMISMDSYPVIQVWDMHLTLYILSSEWSSNCYTYGLEKKNHFKICRLKVKGNGAFYNQIVTQSIAEWNSSSFFLPSLFSSFLSFTNVVSQIILALFQRDIKDLTNCTLLCKHPRKLLCTSWWLPPLPLWQKCFFLFFLIAKDTYD